MQAIRGFVIFVGLAVTLTGLYILVVGVGAPIELPVIEAAGFKASAKGIGTGAVVGVFGLVIMWLAMDRLKRTEEHDLEISTRLIDNPKGTAGGPVGGGGGSEFGFNARTRILQDKFDPP